MQKKWFLSRTQQVTDQEMIPAGVGLSKMVRGVLTIGGTRVLLLVGATDCYNYTQTETIKNFEYCVLSEFTVCMFSGWIIATRRSPRYLARAHPSHPYQGSSPFQCIIYGVTFLNTVILIFTAVQTADIRNVLHRGGPGGQ